jgi:hypothetical protein
MQPGWKLSSLMDDNRFQRLLYRLLATEDDVEVAARFSIARAVSRS